MLMPYFVKLEDRSMYRTLMFVLQFAKRSDIALTDRSRADNGAAL